MGVWNSDWQRCFLLAQEAKGNGGLAEMLFSTPLIPVMLTVIVFYFFIQRAEARKQRESQDMLSQLKKNDTVITAGGICGTIVNAAPDSRFVTLRIDDGNNTRIRILRSAIAGIDTGEVTAEKEST